MLDQMANEIYYSFFIIFCNKSDSSLYEWQQNLAWRQEYNLQHLHFDGQQSNKHIVFPALFLNPLARRKFMDSHSPIYGFAFANLIFRKKFDFRNWFF